MQYLCKMACLCFIIQFQNTSKCTLVDEQLKSLILELRTGSMEAHGDVRQQLNSL